MDGCINCLVLQVSHLFIYFSLRKKKKKKKKVSLVKFDSEK